MTAFYNEIEPYAAAWLANLSAAGHIAPGTVNTTSITELAPDDVRHATQAHFFAGLGAWSYALRLAGWPDDVPVWTGSCPCQPFSVAGKRAGTADARHLWPDWFRLIRECRPVVVFGEQVASRDGYVWLDAVHTDLEGAGYTVGAAVLPAAGVGAPHGRHRLWFVAVASGARLEGLGLGRGARPGREGAAAQRGGADGGVADAGRLRGQSERFDVGGATGAGEAAERERQRFRAHDWAGGVTGDVADPGCDQRGPGRAGVTHGHRALQLAGRGDDGGVADDSPLGRGQGCSDARRGEERVGQAWEPWAGPGLGGGADDPWRACDWVACRDGKARPVEPGTFPLAHGAPARVGRLRAYGNAIVPWVAARFIRAFLDVSA